MNEEPAPTNLKELLVALAQGTRSFNSLHLENLDGVKINFSNCDLKGSWFKEARFGHADFSNANIQGCCFQQAILWGANLSGINASQSFWQEADLSGSRLQRADLSDSFMHKCCLRGVLAANSNWYSTRLVEADFRSSLDQLTDLGESNFENSDLSFALLQGANLQG